MLVLFTFALDESRTASSMHHTGVGAPLPAAKITRAQTRPTRPRARNFNVSAVLAPFPGAGTPQATTGELKKLSLITGTCYFLIRSRPSALSILQIVAMCTHDVTCFLFHGYLQLSRPRTSPTANLTLTPTMVSSPTKLRTVWKVLL